MPPKTPKELADEAAKLNEDRRDDGHSITAGGLKVPNPTRGDFLGNLEKVATPPESDS
jgi:hypothetical protein